MGVTKLQQSLILVSMVFFERLLSICNNVDHYIRQSRMSCVKTPSQTFFSSAKNCVLRLAKHFYRSLVFGLYKELLLELKLFDPCLI